MKNNNWDWDYIGPAIVILAICLGFGGCCAIINLSKRPPQAEEQPIPPSHTKE
jgi:hypothetical protein